MKIKPLRLSSSKSDPLGEQIKEQITLLKVSSQEPTMYVSLVRLGVEHPEAINKTRAFHNQLKREGLPAPRASEIKVIVEQPTVAREFICPNGLTVREAIAQARAKRKEELKKKRADERAKREEEAKDLQAETPGGKTAQPETQGNPPAKKPGKPDKDFYARKSIVAALERVIQLMRMQKLATVDCGVFYLHLEDAVRPTATQE